MPPALDLTTYPNGPGPAPTIMVLPGGGYRHHGAHEGEPVARWLNSLGLHAAVLRYTVGEGCFPQALLDGRSAMEALRTGGTGLDVTPGRLGVLGFSAGGHLAALLATDTDDITGTDPWTFTGRPDAAILCYPVTDLRETLAGRIPNLHTGSGHTFVPDASPELLSELSPSTRTEESTPPIFVWCTSDDEGVPALHSLELMTALAVGAVPFEGHVFRHGEHGLGLADDHPDVAQWQTLCATWLTGLGWIG